MPVSPVTQRMNEGSIAERLGDQRREHVVRALAELGRAAVHGHLAAAVEQQLNARVRQLVPVDRNARAAHVGRACEPYSAPRRELAVLVLPAGHLDHLADALGQARRADVQPARGERVRLGHHAQAQLRGVEPELVGDLVQLHLLAEARLRRAVAALGPAGRLIGEGAAGLELEARQLVGHRRQHPGVERARRAVRAVGAAVEQRLQVHRGQLAVLRHAGAEFHQHRVAPAVLVEHLLAREADLHRAAEDQRRLADHELVVAGIALAAEAASVGHRDNADVRRRHLQHARELAVQVVRVLRAALDHQLAVALDRGERGLLLHRQVRVALVEEQVLEHVLRFRQRLVDVAELVGLVAVDVALLAVVVNARLRIGERLLGAGDGRERPVLHFDQPERLACGLLVGRDHRRHRIADEAHASDGERIFVLRHGHDAVGNREIRAGEHQVDARMRLRARDVDRLDFRVRMRRAQQLAMQHARRAEVVGETQLAGGLGAPVDAPARLADGVEAFLGRQLFGGVHGLASRITRAACSIDSQIC